MNRQPDVQCYALRIVCFLRGECHNLMMHAEAVKDGARPSKFGLISDAHCVLNCEACEVCYRVHYDSDAEGSVTHWSLLAQEIITARHPDHTDIVVLHRLKQF